MNIADAMENAMALSITRGIGKFRKRISRAELERLFREGKFEEVVQAIPWDDMPEDLAEVSGGLETAALRGSEFSITTLPAPARKLRIAVSNPKLRRFIDSQIGFMIQEVSEKSKRSVKAAVNQAFQQAVTPRRASALFRDSIGITEKQNLRIMRARMREVSEKNTLSRRLDSLVATGKGREKTAQNIRFRLRSLTDKQMDFRAEKRIQAATKNRSITIARNELAGAVGEGQEIVWDEAASQGLVDRDKTKRVWVTVPDADRTDICADLDGQKRPLGEPFQSSVPGAFFGAGQGMRQPAHHGCRSAAVIEIDDG